MIREKSCGAVIFFMKDGYPLYLIEKMNVGHFSLCKGHVEHGETEHETAVREVFEETSVSISIKSSFRHPVYYRPRPGVKKEVVYFLAHTDQVETSPAVGEVAFV